MPARGIATESGRWGPYRPASPPPARHRPGAVDATINGPVATATILNDD